MLTVQHLYQFKHDGDLVTALFLELTADDICKFVIRQVTKKPELQGRHIEIKLLTFFERNFTHVGASPLSVMAADESIAQEHASFVKEDIEQPVNETETETEAPSTAPAGNPEVNTPVATPVMLPPVAQILPEDALAAQVLARQKTTEIEVTVKVSAVDFDTYSRTMEMLNSEGDVEIKYTEYIKSILSKNPESIENATIRKS